MGAIDAGLKFYAGYPITPSSEIAETLSELLPKHQGIYLQMEDSFLRGIMVLKFLFVKKKIKALLLKGLCCNQTIIPNI